MSDTEHAVANLYKARFGQLVGALLFTSKRLSPEAVEDIVQDSFAAALENWSRTGVPADPAAWVFRVCKNKALNSLRDQKDVAEISEHTLMEVESRLSESVMDDRHLALLFTCAHPDLAPKIQVAITLKYVANLKVEAIAKSLAMTVDGVDKLLVRARQKISHDKMLLEEPHREQLQARLPTVHKVIYLIFNEGYKTSWGKELIREELCEEALLMNKSLIESPLANKDTFALHALMLFHAARFPSRFDDAGELVDLENQNRGLWNGELIKLGTHYYHKSGGNRISAYHLEASIAYLHCTAARFCDTDWRAIAERYEWMLKGNPNPFVQLNQAVALYYAGQAKAAFDVLNTLRTLPFFKQYYLLNATLGKLHHQEGRDGIARPFLEHALRQTSLAAEQHFIRKLLAKLNQATAPTR